MWQAAIKSLYDRFFGDRTSAEPTRKRRAEEIPELPGSRDSKVRCLGETFDEYNFRHECNVNNSGGNFVNKPQNIRSNNVHIIKWPHNGKENHTLPFSVTRHTMDNQQNCLQDDSDDVQVLEAHNHKSNSNAKQGKGGLIPGKTPPYNGASCSKIVETPVASRSSCNSKEVEVLKFLQSPLSRRQDSEVQIVQEFSSASREGYSHRCTSSLRRPFKTMNSSSSGRTSSTPIAFTSCRPLVPSSEQPEIEVLQSSSMANGVSGSHYAAHNSKLSHDSSCMRNRNTLSSEKFAESKLTYNKMFLGSVGVEQTQPFYLLGTNSGWRSTPRNERMSPHSCHTTSSQFLRSPIDSRVSKEISTSLKDASLCKGINIPVNKKNNAEEPSTSASRLAQAEDGDLQYLGQVNTPNIVQQQYGSEILEEIISKYRRMDDDLARAKEQEREVKMIEDRNKQAGIARKKMLNMELVEQLQQFLRVVEEPEVEEKSVPSLPELTSEMEAEIDKALTAPQNMVLSRGFNLEIKGRDMYTLRPLAWLNDEVINFYMNLLIERGKSENYPSVYAFNTFFFPQLVTKGYDSLKRWTKKVDVFSHEYLLIPVHRGSHWCMAIIFMKDKIVRYYDSMDGKYPKCADALLDYLQKESMDKKKQPYDTTSWTKEHAEDIPQQNNGSDCGMFACMYAEYVSRAAPITFSQDDMPYFRRKVVYEILKCKLLT